MYCWVWAGFTTLGLGKYRPLATYDPEAAAAAAYADVTASLLHMQAFVAASQAADDATFAGWLRTMGLITAGGYHYLGDRSADASV